MNLEKRLKKHINSNLDKVTPNPYKKKKHFPLWAKIMIPVAAVSLTILIPIAVINANNLENIVGRLKGTYVDMEGVSAFGVGNIQSGANKYKLKSLKYLDNSSSDDSDDSQDNTSSWTEEERERYEWEADYDWDPDKANVLVSLDEEGKVTEVVYERTNNKGVVRQDKLGNCAAVYVSKSFTYAMYVNDTEWDFWKDINYAQELHSPTGFHVHHEMMQTIVIHNETGKVFALKDLMTQVSKITGAKNYTMQADPTKDDFVCVDPMYGNYDQMTPLWFKVIYNPSLDKIIYKNVLPEGSGYRRSHDAKEDKYGQTYVLADDEGYDQTRRLEKDNEFKYLTNPTIIGKTLITHKTNSVFFGNDNRAYAFNDGKLKVFGRDFKLEPIEEDTVVNFEGLANEFFSSLNDTGWLNGSCFHYEHGYLFSSFGEVWKVDENGSFHQEDDLEGSFPKYTNDVFMIGGSIIAYTNTREYFHYSVDGGIVEFKFTLKEGQPSLEEKMIISATSYSSYGHRIVVEQDENGGYGFNRGPTKYYLLTAFDGEVKAQYIVFGNNGGVKGVAGTISEPIDVSK